VVEMLGQPSGLQGSLLPHYTLQKSWEQYHLITFCNDEACENVSGTTITCLPTKLALAKLRELRRRLSRAFGGTSWLTTRKGLRNINVMMRPGTQSGNAAAPLCTARVCITFVNQLHAREWPGLIPGR
jgi:hypothetical protein